MTAAPRSLWRGARRRVNGEIVQHAHRIFAAVVVRLLTPCFTITQPFVEAARRIITRTQLEPDGEDARRTRGRFEPFEQRPAETLSLISGLHGEQREMRVHVVELHD